jgi:hypothetical protein
VPEGNLPRDYLSGPPNRVSVNSWVTHVPDGRWFTHEWTTKSREEARDVWHRVLRDLSEDPTRVIPQQDLERTRPMFGNGFVQVTRVESRQVVETEVVTLPPPRAPTTAAHEC